MRTPEGLHTEVAHYHRTGDALVPMLQMQDALTGSKVAPPTAGDTPIVYNFEGF